MFSLCFFFLVTVTFFFSKITLIITVIDFLRYNTGGDGGLVLPQLDFSDFVDSPWEVLLFLKSRWGKWEGKVSNRGSGKREERGN